MAGFFLAGGGLGSRLLQQCVVHGWSSGICLLCMPVCNHKPYTLRCLETSLMGFGNREGIISLKKREGRGWGDKCLCSGLFHEGVLLSKHHYHSDVK